MPRRGPAAGNTASRAVPRQPIWRTFGWGRNVAVFHEWGSTRLRGLFC